MLGGPGVAQCRVSLWLPYGRGSRLSTSVHPGNLSFASEVSPFLARPLPTPGQHKAVSLNARASTDPSPSAAAHPATRKHGQRFRRNPEPDQLDRAGRLKETVDARDIAAVAGASAQAPSVLEYYDDDSAVFLAADGMIHSRISDHDDFRWQPGAPRLYLYQEARARFLDAQDRGVAHAKKACAD